MASDIQVKYVLVATGSTSSPQLDILIHETEEFEATVMATSMVRSLYGGRYSRFTLVLVNNDNQETIRRFIPTETVDVEIRKN